MKPKNYLLTFGFVLTSVVSTYFVTTSTAQQGATMQTVTTDNESQTGAILFHQKVAEYRALCLQAFNSAHLTIDADDKTKKKLPKIERKIPCAVVVDIDETVLDNSPAQAFDVKNRQPFDLKTYSGFHN